MTDSYQAIYDAVRSRIGNADIGSAVERAMHDANLSHYAEMVMRTAQEAAGEHMRPCVIHRPALSADGDMWCVLLGDNLQEGVAGFGKTPAEAMWEFDRAFLTQRTPTAIRNALAPLSDGASTRQDGTDPAPPYEPSSSRPSQ